MDHSARVAEIYAFAGLLKSVRVFKIRVVAMVGGAGRGRPPLTISARHKKKKVSGTMFHNRGSIIAQYMYIHIENDLVRV